MFCFFPKFFWLCQLICISAYILESTYQVLQKSPAERLCFLCLFVCFWVLLNLYILGEMPWCGQRTYLVWFQSLKICWRLILWLNIWSILMSVPLNVLHSLSFWKLRFLALESHMNNVSTLTCHPIVSWLQQFPMKSLL